MERRERKKIHISTFAKFCLLAQKTEQTTTLLQIFFRLALGFFSLAQVSHVQLID